MCLKQGDSLFDHMNKLCTRHSSTVKFITFLLCVWKAMSNSKGANPTPLFCCATCLVWQQQHWSQWWKHFVFLYWSHWSTHPQKMVTSWEMNGFYFSIILQSWNESLYLTLSLLRGNPLQHPFSSLSFFLFVLSFSFPFFLSTRMIDNWCSRRSFFFSPFVLVSGLMQCLLD